MFNKLQNKLKPLREYRTLMFKHKLNPIISRFDTKKALYNKSKVVGVDVLCAAICFLILKNNIKINETVLEMVVVSVKSWLNWIKDSNRLVSHFLSVMGSNKSFVDTLAGNNLKLLGTFAIVCNIVII